MRLFATPLYRSVSLGLLHAALLICFAGITARPLLAQSGNAATDGSTPKGLEAGAPAGTYSLGGFDQINYFNGNLSFMLPLLKAGGRGSVGYTIPLKIERRWRGLKTPSAPWGFWAEPYDWESVESGYGPGVLIGRVIGAAGQYCNGGSPATTETLTRLTFKTGDGTEYELRDTTTLNGGSSTTTWSYCDVGYTPNRGKVFVSGDGAGVTFISDVDIMDAYTSETKQMFPTGDLLMPDGSRYRIVDGYVFWLRDRNGNKLTFEYGYGGLSKVKDSLNREVTIAYGADPATPYDDHDEITMKGYGGATRTIKVWFSPMNQVLRSGFTIQTYQQLFPEMNGSWSTNFDLQQIVSSVELPDGRRYYFKYNSYGELARVELPTGGAFEYDYGGGLAGGPSSGVYGGNGPYIGKQVYRRVTEKRIYKDSGTTYEAKITISRPEDNAGNNQGYVVVEQRDFYNTLRSSEKHYYYGSAKVSAGQLPYNYSKWKDGKEWKTEILDSNGSTILRRSENTWQQPLNGATWPLTTPESSDTVRANNPQITETISTLVDTNQVSKQIFLFDQYLNKTDAYEYDYGTGAAGALIRRTHTDFLTTNPVNSANYATNNSIYIRSLPSQTQVFDASNNKKAETKFEYDDYSASANYAALVNRTNISGFDAAFTTSYTTRGNVTKVSQWRNTDGAYLAAHSQYDIAGNVVKTIDANSNATTLEFDDRFGSPNGEAQSNNTPPAPGSTWLNGQSTFAFPTKVTNALGHIAYTQIDYFLGKPVDVEDPNNVKASLYYNDVLDRPTKNIRAVGTTLANQTVITYDDTNKTITTATDKDTNTDGILQSKTFYDGLGRTYRKATYEGTVVGYANPQWAIVETQFDALGRAWRSSNPFRGDTPAAALPGNPQWTISTFDALSRVTQVTPPDNSAVTTTYSGNQVTVTDQAGKNRKSETDALGRLAKVWENPTGLNYLTSYNYDVLDNLLTTTQTDTGTNVTQTRTFVYDSLKRLTSVTNPESGTTTYQYDNNGNLTFKQDALTRMTWYGYDALNRSTGYYTNNSNTPQVVNIYDTLPNGKGRLGYGYTASYWVGCTSWKYLTYNPISSYDVLGRPSGQTQYYRDAADTTWGTAYTTSRTYDLASNVKSQTYPSGRVVNYTYNAASQLSDFTGNLGDGTSRNYATGIKYNERGQMMRETFGTTTNLFHRRYYNRRGQMFDARLGTDSNIAYDVENPAVWRWATGTWNRGAIRLYYSSTFNDYDDYTVSNGALVNNNGNVNRMEHFVPGNDSVTTYSISIDKYTYDALNRIQDIKEFKQTESMGETDLNLKQTYVYDRFGNRTVNNALSNFPGIFNSGLKIDQTTNRLKAITDSNTDNANDQMRYDLVGNQWWDTYTGAGNRTYDANL